MRRRGGGGGATQMQGWADFAGVYHTGHVVHPVLSALVLCAICFGD